MHEHGKRHKQRHKQLSPRETKRTQENPHSDAWVRKTSLLQSNEEVIKRVESCTRKVSIPAWPVRLRLENVTLGVQHSNKISAFVAHMATLTKKRGHGTVKPEVSRTLENTLKNWTNSRLEIKCSASTESESSATVFVCPAAPLKAGCRSSSTTGHISCKTCLRENGWWRPSLRWRFRHACPSHHRHKFTTL